MFKTLTTLDGGLSSLLESKGFTLSGDPLWSARLLSTHPDSIVKAHTEFLEAGAEVLTSCSYQANVDNLQKHLSVTESQAVELICKSVELAKQAREEFMAERGVGRRIIVAGSIGPYGACLADRSEYTGSYLETISEEALREWHRPRIAALLHAGVDVLAIETIPGTKEAVQIARVLKEFIGAKAWITFSCKDGKSTSSGENVKTAFEKTYIENPGQIVAIGFNCTYPSHITSLLSHIDKIMPEVPRIVYPNSPGYFQGSIRETDQDVLEAYESQLKNWIELGARVVGGCCGVLPPAIKILADNIRNLS